MQGVGTNPSRQRRFAASAPHSGGMQGEGDKLLAIHNLEEMQLTENVVIDTTRDAVVIDGVTKIFKKHRPLLRWSRKEQKDEKREVRAVDNVTMTVKRREIIGILGANGAGK